MKKLYARWIAPTPKFWKNVQKLGFALSTLALAIFPLAQKLPPFMVEIAPHLLSASLVLAFISQLTIEGGQENAK